MGGGGGGESSSGEEDGDADWRAAISSVSAIGIGVPASNGSAKGHFPSERDEPRHEQQLKAGNAGLKLYQIKAQKLLDDLLSKSLEIVRDPVPILNESNQVNEGCIRLFRKAPPGMTIHSVDPHSLPRKKPRILPGEDINEKSKKFKYQLRSVAVDGADILATARDACQRSQSRFEAKDAAAKAAAKREEERVAELRKVRGEEWLPSIAREMQFHNTDMTDTNQDSSKKRTRGVTTTAQLKNKLPPGEKYAIDFDVNSGRPVGENSAQFVTYIGYLARSKVSILIPKWREVPEMVKDLIWQETMDLWEVPTTEKAKKKLMTYVGERWKDFKTTLTRTYIFGKGDKDGCTNPCAKYNFISEEVWQEFVRSRQSEDFQKIRAKAKENNAKNVYPHTLSRGGYDKLKKDVLSQRVRSLEEGTDGKVISLDEVPKPDRFELWTLARTKSSGSYTSEAVTPVAEKMKSLAEAESQGSFHSKGRQDILTVAIGTPEHPGRVRTAGRGMGFTNVFGRQSRIKPSTQMELESIRTEMREEMRTEMMQMFEIYKSKLEADMVATTIQQSGPSPRDTARVSTKGSCSPSTEEDEPNKPVAAENEALNRMGRGAYDLPNGTVHLPLDHDEELTPFYIFSKDLTDMSYPEPFWCANQHLQLWSSYLHRLCAENDTSHVYEILDPTRMIITSESFPEVHTYLQDKLLNLPGKEVFLSSLIHEKHWQMVAICPKANLVVFICSLHRKPIKLIKTLINSVMEKCGGEGKPEWNLIHGPRQRDNWARGFYVMKAMLDIVTLRITSSWGALFHEQDTAPYKHDDLLDLRIRWAKFFLIKMEENKANIRPSRRRRASERAREQK